MELDRQAFSDPNQPKSSDGGAVFPPIPKAWTRKKRYLLFAGQVYDQFQKECRIYRYGGGRGTEGGAGEEPSVDVELVQDMAVLLNEKIRKVNNQAASECTLQFVRSMDLHAAEAEQVSGSVLAGRYSSGMAESLCFLPVDIEKLPIAIYPVPPEYVRVKTRLHGFFTRFYGQNRQKIDQVMARLESDARKIRRR
jgi:hypothetical protein